eukprot:TRINITY_DN25950_c0_g1_i2.p1 TRINITY_DN25950_c0_g1~~TRINITY_DN25950_c0_g1_i2.p1  ORF type:complete len:699 (+),score=149.97 TRINITY_DN25950_c0_g1_i2:132-2228(+)
MALSADSTAKLEAFKNSVSAAKNKRHLDLLERRKAQFTLKESENGGLSQEQLEAAKQNLGEQQNSYLRQYRTQVNIMDFEIIQTIGMGAFGIVRLCRKKDSGEIFALKQMIKTDMVQKNKVHHVRAERDILTKASDGWVTRLHYTFQDDEFLYMVLDYLPGGDLMTHLMRKDIFTEDETRFYIAELVEAIDYIHTALQYVHRDIKPDNIIFDAEGHIRLLDFGLCKHLLPSAFEREALLPAQSAARPKACHRRVTSRTHIPRTKMNSFVGTADYIAPEIYRSEDYGKECDWWAVGIIMFEMLFGGPPFSDDQHNLVVTAHRVKRWQEHFHIPTDMGASPEAIDLLRKLICDPQDRLTGPQIRLHPFFRGLDFSRLREMEPPIKPEVTSPIDTQNFDEFNEEDAKYRVSSLRHHTVGDQNLFAFYDFAYRRDLESKKPNAMTALSSVAPEVAEQLQSSGRGEPEAWMDLAGDVYIGHSSASTSRPQETSPLSPLSPNKKLSVIAEGPLEEKSPRSAAARSRAASSASSLHSGQPFVAVTSSMTSSGPSAQPAAHVVVAGSAPQTAMNFSSYSSGPFSVPKAVTVCPGTIAGSQSSMAPRVPSITVQPAPAVGRPTAATTTAGATVAASQAQPVYQIHNSPRQPTPHLVSQSQPQWHMQHPTPKAAPAPKALSTTPVQASAATATHQAAMQPKGGYVRRM